MPNWTNAPIWTALAHHNRRRVLDALVPAPLSAHQLAHLLALSPSEVNRHLHHLYASKLLEAQVHGPREVRFQLHPQGVTEALRGLRALTQRLTRQS